MAKPVYVIGHRSPDTDSICSAIGYAHLKQALGESAVPARAGKINAETKFVLEYFGVKMPALINDFYPRVKDIMTDRVVTVSPQSTVRELGQLMKQHNVKSVPVVESGSTLVGIVTVGDLAKRYFDELEMQDLSEAGVDYASVLRALDGRLVCGQDLDRPVTGKVRIAGARTQTMAQLVEPGDIVLVGDRNKAQLVSIEQGIACLVVTGGAAVTDAVEQSARSRGVIIISTPYDTYTCARLINQSIPVRMIMQTKVVVFKPTDLVADIKSVIVATNHRNYPVVENGRLIGLINRDRLIVPEREKVILVDHNEPGQAAEGIEEAQIVEIIDHHRLGGLETSEPIFICHEPVGATATIVANMYWHRHIDIPSQIAGLLLAAILSDTLLFKSPTATPKDRETAEKLAAAAGLDIQEFGRAVLKAGSSIAGLTPAELIQSDLKEFLIGEYRVAIAQVSVMEPAELLGLKDELLQAMQSLRAKENYDLVLLMITDILSEATHLVFVGQPAALVSQAFGQPARDGVLYLPGVMSRKKQVVPPLIEAARAKVGAP
ncbi:Inorganic diphosphatase [Thermosinus carboxydivorans Nor1]|uniref:inorganic diphosphatase n=1 Tax=Thermosinus carboxydivorans Nor1 TaxID=401526 RepID=A1HME9_9FIRM|nr:putative manganese-dependent inorganic diphosphatase [Thermosinus carboxydivorans]EAX48989.1 Inorganic diphosphatase [Thermosinus carboxydivorans Nor1]